jgi:hypothetical protein
LRGNTGCELRERGGRGSGVERLRAAPAEHLRKTLGIDTAEQQVRVRDGERPAAPVTRRPRIGAGRLRTHGETTVGEPEYRAAAGSDGFDLEHRRAHSDGADHGVGGSLELARVQRHVGRRAAHVEADDFRAADAVSRTHHANDAAGRPGQQAIPAAKVLGTREPSVALHEQQPPVVEPLG